MSKTDCPGLKWRKRKDGRRVPVWCAPAAAVKAGFNIKTWQMDWCPPEDLPLRCQMIWKEALDFIGKQRDPLEYTGTIASLMNLYVKHPSSSYRRLTASTIEVYNSYIDRIVQAYGGRRISNLTGLDIMRWHSEIQGDQHHIGAASMAVSVLKAALGFGQVCGFEDCAKLRTTMAALKLPSPRPRETAPDAKQVEAAMEAAWRLTRPSAALAIALQFETSARQYDVIGQWVPMSDPRPSTYFFLKKKWIGPAWACIDENKILEITPSKTERTTGKRVRVDLKLCPFVMRALQSVELQAGPLIIDDHTGQPFRPKAYVKLWQKIRREAGLPSNLWNRDLRAGAITEASMGGASADDRAKQAGHSVKINRKVYDRDVLESARRVSEARKKFREGKE